MSITMTSVGPEPHKRTRTLPLSAQRVRDPFRGFPAAAGLSEGPGSSERRQEIGVSDHMRGRHSRKRRDQLHGSSRLSQSAPQKEVCADPPATQWGTSQTVAAPQRTVPPSPFSRFRLRALAASQIRCKNLTKPPKVKGCRHRDTRFILTVPVDVSAGGKGVGKQKTPAWCLRRVLGAPMLLTDISIAINSFWTPSGIVPSSLG